MLYFFSLLFTQSGLHEEGLRKVGLSPKMQQKKEQVSITVAEIERVHRERGVCRLMVYGVGYNIESWLNLNREGRRYSSKMTTAGRRK